MTYRIDKRLYLSGNKVVDKQPSEGQLYCRPGVQVTDRDIEARPELRKYIPELKQRKAPNKAVKAPANKGASNE